jgi:hypothetical protein
MDELKSADAPPYEAPTIEDVPLHPDEMVVANCKTNTGPAPGVSGGIVCAACSAPTNS